MNEHLFTKLLGFHSRSFMIQNKNHNKKFNTYDRGMIKYGRGMKEV